MRIRRLASMFMAFCFMTITPLVSEAAGAYYGADDNDIAFTFINVPTSTYLGHPVTALEFTANVDSERPAFGDWRFFTDNNTLVDDWIMDLDPYDYYIDPDKLINGVLIAVLRLSQESSVSADPELWVWYHPCGEDQCPDGRADMTPELIVTNYVPANVPEPSVAALLGLGVLAMGLTQRRRKAR
jgi:hypothetical protein